MALKMIVDVYGFGLSFGESRDQFKDGFKTNIVYFVLKTSERKIFISPKTFQR